MKALSVRQPWAWLIIRPDITDPAQRAKMMPGLDYKQIENRNWKCPPQGLIAIHASKTFDPYGYRWVCEQVPKVALFMPEPDAFERGGIIGTVEHVGCVEDFASIWFCGPWGHLLDNPRPCVFVKCPGRLGFFDMPDKWIRYVE